ncbi:MAG TPA: TonB family protein [Kofleriaceae bacterium]|nr:TonB family protein [Kofleriaceae bacterium]
MLLIALGFSLAAQAGVLVTYAVTRPTPQPALTVRIAGEGEGQVLVSKITKLGVVPVLRCKQPRCRIELPAGTELKLSTTLGEEATFGGYHQLPMRTPHELVPILGDPLASCTGGDPLAAALGGDVLECSFKLAADTDIAVDLGLAPKEIEVAIQADPTNLDALVKPAVPPPTAPRPPPIEAEKLEEPLQVAIAPPPPPPPKPEEPKPTPPKPVQPPPPNMVMVEVKDKNVVDKAPDDAKALSDKNRDVAEETRATETNLDKESEGTQVASREHDDTTSKEIGGPDDRIRQLEETKPTTSQRVKETDHSGKHEEAKGEIVGEAGKNGEEGTGPKEPGLLAIRGIEGRGSLADQGKDGKKVGKRGLPGVNTPLSFSDYERIMGKEKLDEERQVAARKMSSKKGRWERKLEAVQSSLENFVPDVRPGNQTALKTRAAPFAVYIARMHRTIHEQWSFGFLSSLDDRPATHPLNNIDLWTNLEIAVNPNGSVHKVTIAKTSGNTEFDVAAVDAVLSAGPYEPTPEAIRSVNGKIYLRWGFYRNTSACGTFNVEPYILTEVPDDGGKGLDDGELVRNTAKLPGKKRVATGDKPVTPDDGRAAEPVNPSSSVTDAQALFAAHLWVSAFTTAQVDKLVKYSIVPFYAGGKVAAQTQADLKEMYSGLVVESGQMKDWKLLTASEYGSGAAALPEGTLVLQVRTAKESFAIVLTRTKSGDYRATQLAR